MSAVLIIDDDAGMCELLEHDLHARGHRVVSAQSAEEAVRCMAATSFDVVVADINLGGMSGVAFCEATRSTHPDLPVVVMTARGTTDEVIRAIRAGAYDFVTKPFHLEQLAIVVDRALGLHALRREVLRLRAAVHDGSPGAILGESAAIQELRELIARVAQSDATALIVGQSGTGKELVARAIHDGSARKNGPFIAINCAAMPENLLESELFGHARGAFTDAKTARAGLFVRADRGTLFLDEIGEMPLGMQAKLLRALQERRVRPVGGDEVDFDARVIAATNRDLEQDIEDQRFRQDLYYRINVVKILTPPLAHRANDVLLLAQHFIEVSPLREVRGVDGMSPDFAKKLLAYDWPGNVRELQNCIERATAVATGPVLALEDLPDKIRDNACSRADVVVSEDSSLPTFREVERRYILAAFKAMHGNKSAVADALGLNRRTLYRKLDRIHVTDD